MYAETCNKNHVARNALAVVGAATIVIVLALAAVVVTSDGAGC